MTGSIPARPPGRRGGWSRTAGRAGSAPPASWMASPNDGYGTTFRSVRCSTYGSCRRGPRFVRLADLGSRSPARQSSPRGEPTTEAARLGCVVGAVQLPDDIWLRESRPESRSTADAAFGSRATAVSCAVSDGSRAGGTGLGREVFGEEGCGGAGGEALFAYLDVAAGGVETESGFVGRVGADAGDRAVERLGGSFDRAVHL